MLWVYKDGEMSENLYFYPHQHHFQFCLYRNKLKEIRGWCSAEQPVTPKCFYLVLGELSDNKWASMHNEGDMKFLVEE